MNVPQEDLNLWRRFFDALRATCRATVLDLDSGNVQHARQLVEKTEDAGRRMGLRLEKAGAERPDAPMHSFSDAVPLHLLDTPANRCLAEALQVAWEAGLAVDRERYGESIGTDGVAGAIEALLADVEEEIGGPVGMVRE